MTPDVSERTMFAVRPVESSDIPALEVLADTAPASAHTLPRSRKAIERAVERSRASFAAHTDMPSDEQYVFVLESAEREVIGSATISASAGRSGTFFAFRNDVFRHHSRDMGIGHNVRALTLCSGLTGHSQLSGFYVRPDHCTGYEASLLSRARLMFAAAAPQRFSEWFFAALAGVVDAGGASPFWEAVGRNFFQTEFLTVERLIEGERDRTLIAELMPHYPLYVPLLPQCAQAVVGRVHPEGERPLGILASEGFLPGEYVDIFDSGPTVQAHRNTLRAFSASTRRRVTGRQQTSNTAHSSLYLVATERSEGFRATLAECTETEFSDEVALDEDVKRLLDVADGDALRLNKL
jgi:arginine N-succinyltransferase